MNTPNEPIKAHVVGIGGGSEYHLAISSTGLSRAYCKGMRTHRAFKVSDDLGTITCQKCKARAVKLGLIKS